MTERCAMCREWKDLISPETRDFLLEMIYIKPYRRVRGSQRKEDTAAFKQRGHLRSRHREQKQCL